MHFISFMTISLSQANQINYLKNYKVDAGPASVTLLGFQEDYLDALYFY